MKTSATIITAVAPQSKPKTTTRFSAKNFDAVEALVMPELITAKATRKVRKWMPNAFCV
jgi:hypothetical protein